ncbi:MAG: hypothetical protein JSV62_00080 [Promethearchaeota archaeon]|nr:MAG: hypothetical protein JSV62_00080 [Candidatus Lokiarchaeota archaeon]
MGNIYICTECGYVFPEELSQLIESDIQVYCERCGSPFIIEGIKFKPAPTPYLRKKKPYHVLSEKKSSNLEKLILFLNKISFIPLFIFTCVSFGLIAEIIISFNMGILFDRIIHGLLGLFLLIYDRTYIAPKVKEKKFNTIFLDAFCWGILGCILYGTGVIVLIKGIFIIIYVISDSKNTDFKTYEYGLLAKNSLNYFSAKAGLLIVLFGVYRAYSDRIYIPTGWRIIINVPIHIEIPLELLIYFCFLVIALIVLLIDNRSRKKIKEKQKFTVSDGFKYFILGIFGVLFYATGIFILLKGILIFFLVLGKPKEFIEKSLEVDKTIPHIPVPPTPPSPPVHPYKRLEHPPLIVSEEKEKEPKISEKPSEIETPEVPHEEGIKIEPKKIEEIPKRDLEEIPIKTEEERIRREKEFELKLHDSLLPVKDERDKKLVKEYFSKIFAVLSKDLRKQIRDLKISKKEKNELLEELAFLTKEEQVKYIEAIVDLYKEIPKKLITRIRKLPNVKPKHYDKIVDELKYMDYDEQIKFIQFLEENA